MLIKVKVKYKTNDQCIGNVWVMISEDSRPDLYDWI